MSTIPVTPRIVAPFTSVDQDGKLEELKAKGITALELDKGWTFEKRETKARLTVGDIAAVRREMELYAKDVFSSSVLHFTFAAEFNGITYRLGIGATHSDAIAVTM